MGKSTINGHFQSPCNKLPEGIPHDYAPAACADVRSSRKKSRAAGRTGGRGSRGGTTTTGSLLRGRHIGPAAMGINLTGGGWRRISGKWNIGKSPLNGDFSLLSFLNQTPQWIVPRQTRVPTDVLPAKPVTSRKCAPASSRICSTLDTRRGENLGNGLFQHVPNNCHRFP